MNYLFDVVIPLGLKHFSETVVAAEGTVCFRVDDNAWTLRLGEDASCVQGDSGNADCTIVISGADVQRMLRDPNVGAELYFEGKLSILGDLGLAHKLRKLFEISRET